MKKTLNMLMRSCTIVLLLVFTAQALDAQEAPWYRRQVVSPEIHDDNTVTFRMFAPEINELKISGGWMAGWGASESMVKNDTGLWSLTVGPLEPEIYTYSFAADGVRIMDPANIQVMRDGRRYASMILVPGEASKLYAVKDVPHGSLSKVWYSSPTLELTRRMYVYTPPGYLEGDEAYPVLYLLHGGGGDEDAWTTLGRACQIMDNLIASGKAKKMIVVMTNGNPQDAASPGEAPPMKASGDVFQMGAGLFEKSLVNDVIPYVEANYRTLNGRENRAVTGLSMGGMQTMNLAFEYTEVFDYFGVMSMGITQPRQQGGPTWFQNVDEGMANLEKEGYKLFWIACGTEDFLHEAALTLKAKMEENDLPFKYRESGGGHTWSNWRVYLSEYAPMLFK